MEIKRLYLAGPIRGIPDFKKRFAHAAGELRAAGFKVFNPVEQDEAFEVAGTPVTIRHCLELDLVWICRWAHIVGLLDGWERSSGAMAEFYTAKALGIETWEIPLGLQLPYLRPTHGSSRDTGGVTKEGVLDWAHVLDRGD